MVGLPDGCDCVCSRWTAGARLVDRRPLPRPGGPTPACRSVRGGWPELCDGGLEPVDAMQQWPPVFCSVTTGALPDRIHTTGALLH